MTAKIKHSTKEHMFMPGDTLSGAIKKYNFYDVTSEEMKGLLAAFSTINSLEDNVKPGQRFMIPILRRHMEKYNQPSK